VMRWEKEMEEVGKRKRHLKDWKNVLFAWSLDWLF
jgi:hypothetical protein